MPLANGEGLFGIDKIVNTAYVRNRQERYFMSQCSLAEQEHIVQSLYMEPQHLAGMLTLGHGLMGRLFLLKHTFMLYLYERKARKLHTTFMNFFAQPLPMTQERKKIFVNIEEKLTQKLTSLGISIKKAQRKNMPSFFVNKLLDFEDALSDALFCLQAELDTEFQDLLIELQKQAISSDNKAV